MAVNGHAVVGTPVCHNAVRIGERPLSGQARAEPRSRSGRVGALVDGVVNLIGQISRPSLGNLQDGANPLHNVEAQHRDRHLCLATEVAGISATAEVLIVRTAPIGGVQARLDVRIGHLPERLHHVVTLDIHAGTGTIQSRCAGIDEVNKAVGSNAVRLLPCHTLAGFGASVGAHIMEARCRTGNKAAQHHGNAVAGVVLSSERSRGLRAVPVKGRSHADFGEVSIRRPVYPLALALETTDHSVAAERFFMPAHLVKTRIAVQNVADNQGHLDDKLPILVGRNDLRLRDDRRQILAEVLIKAPLQFFRTHTSAFSYSSWS